MTKPINLNLNNIIDLKNNSLVEASAGTGKTFSITKLVLQAVLIQNIKIEEILVVTFTEAATKELRSRIRKELHEFEKYISNTDEDKKRIEEYEAIIQYNENNDKKDLSELIKKALLNIDQAAIFTIHSFCQRMLTENAFESKIAFGSELLTDTSELVLEIAENFWRKNMVNISKEEQKLLAGVKFDDILKLTKEFIRYNNVELVNTSKYTLNENKEILENLDLDELKEEYSDITKEVYKQLSEQNLKDLEEEMLDFFNEIAPNLKGDLANKKFDETIKNLFKKIPKESLDLKGMSIFSHKDISENKVRLNKKKFILDEKRFFKIGEDIPRLKEIKKIINSAVYEKLFNYTKSELTRIKEKQHILTFDDLIVKLYEVLSDEAESPENQPLTNLIREKFKLAFVDEFQDTDKIQYKIFKCIFGDNKEHGFFMIGDPKQSIYKFRGADIYSYLQAKEDSNAQYSLQNNYRSEKGMIKAVNSLFEFKNNIFASPGGLKSAKIDFIPAEFGESPKKTIFKDARSGNNSSQANLHLWTVSGFKKKFIEHNICKNVAKEIFELMKPNSHFVDNKGEEIKKLSFGDFAVLVNTHKQAAKMKTVLAQSNIPAVIQKSAKIFESNQALEFKFWLKTILKPSEKNIRNLFVTDLLPKNANEIEDITNVDIINLTDQFKLLNKFSKEFGLYAAFIHFINEYNVMDKALKSINGERIITNYFHIAELLHQHELKAGKNLENSLAFLDLEMQDGDENDEKQEQLESDKESVKIMTIHASKGLQFSIVFCPFIWDNAITKGEDKQKIFLFNEFEEGKNIQKLDLGADNNTFKENQKSARLDTLAEHVRLLYVALTRAENRCYLIFGDDKTTAKSVFSYIFTSLNTAYSKDLPHSKNGTKLEGKTAELFPKFEDLKNEILNNLKSLKKQNLIHLEKKGLISEKFIYSSNAIQPDTSKIELMSQKSKHLSQKWAVGSFSSLISNIPYENDNAKTGEGIFQLPGGKIFGTAIHKIFENYYTKKTDSLDLFSDEKLRIQQFENILKVESYFRNEDSGISKERFGIAEQMFQNTLTANIKVEDSEIQLKDISAQDAKPEFSFCYKVNKISPKLLKEIFKNFIVEDNLNDFENKLDELKFSLKKGYLTGEIDLLFRNKNKYFVLDWKTNNLGSNISDYSPDKIKNNMVKHLYLLQAHIYSLATHLFLKQSLEDYDYDTHFGGFIYIYTRGVGENGNGIYFNKPSRKLIEKLEKEICK